jgi:biotin carboxyl carrier protein
MKMEIPVVASASGTLKAVLVKVDDVVAEGQAVAVVES